jgi:hypothetical protein
MTKKKRTVAGALIGKNVTTEITLLRFLLIFRP